MPTLIECEEPEIETFDSVVAKLGVPLSRILSRPAPGTATEEDVLRLAEAPCRRFCELVDGVLIEKPRNFISAILATELAYLLLAWIRPRRLGMVLGPNGLFRIEQGRIHIPNVAYLPWTAVPSAQLRMASIANVVPALAVEILSESNTVKEMDQKREDYFALGVQAVWICDPETRSVDWFLSPTEATTYGPGQLVPGEPILPGFQLSIDEWFSVLDRPTV